MGTFIKTGNILFLELGMLSGTVYKFIEPSSSYTLFLNFVILHES